MLCHAPIGLFFQFSDERLPHHHMGSPPGGCNVLKIQCNSIWDCFHVFQVADGNSDIIGGKFLSFPCFLQMIRNSCCCFRLFNHVYSELSQRKPRYCKQLYVIFLLELSEPKMNIDRDHRMFILRTWMKSVERRQTGRSKRETSNKKGRSRYSLPYFPLYPMDLPGTSVVYFREVIYCYFSRQYFKSLVQCQSTTNTS